MDLTLSGTTVRGKGIGRSIGFPTANLQQKIDDKITDGVYYGKVILDGKEHKAVLCIGHQPHFNNSDNSSSNTLTEVHILDIPDVDYYGSFIQVKILGFIREMKKYESTAQLSTAIADDICLARVMLE